MAKSQKGNTMDYVQTHTSSPPGDAGLFVASQPKSIIQLLEERAELIEIVRGKSKDFDVANSHLPNDGKFRWAGKEYFTRGHILENRIIIPSETIQKAEEFFDEMEEIYSKYAIVEKEEILSEAEGVLYNKETEIMAATPTTPLEAYAQLWILADYSDDGFDTSEDMAKLVKSFPALFSLDFKSLDHLLISR